MAMIDAKDAKNLLGCDDATLNQHISSGAIRAQRSGGKLTVEQDDVEKLVQDKDDEGTIVLTGDSDDLSIDLGKVVDDSADTIISGRDASKSGPGTESITFGDELEVVNFDDKTSELVFDETKQTGNVQNLSFTDSNTAVLTAVDETSVGATTAPIDFQTSVDEGSGQRSSQSSRGTARRSRTGSRAIEAVQVHWVWPSLLVATAAITVFFVVPYFVITMYPFGTGDEKLANKDRRLGSDDNAWVSMAGSIAGFSVEPNREKWTKLHGGDGEWIDMQTVVDPQAQSRLSQYRGDKKEVGERLNSFIITAVDEEKKLAKSDPGTEYPIREIVTPAPSGEIKELNVDIFTK
jgi:hypothetical protein